MLHLMQAMKIILNGWAGKDPFNSKNMRENIFRWKVYFERL